MRTLDLSRAEFVVVPASVIKETDREIKTERCKVFVVVPDDVSEQGMIDYLDALAVVRWGPKVQEAGQG